MKEQLIEQFNEEHKEEIQAVNYLMQKIKPQLEEFKSQYPNVGIMLYFGIMNDVQHWVSRMYDMRAELAIQICTGMIKEIIDEGRRK